MSAAAAARSPSPGPARPCCGLRRSADSSPFRPIASTPDSTQRSASVGKSGGRAASSRALWAEKENDNNNPRDAARTQPKAARHSSGGGGGGGAKSFMAPTFSAASKAVAPSATPRKKVLGERNNDLPQQHPIPSSPGEISHGGKLRGPPPPQPEEPIGAPRRLRLSLDGAPPAPPPVAAPVAVHGAWPSIDAEAEAEEEVVVVEKPVCKIHHHQHETSGDAAAPYDPKTNYLSPRPQFLRYRPNPRVEQYRQGSGGGSARRLEDGFASSESSEEADNATTTEEGLSEEEQEQVPTSPEESSALAPAPDARADAATPVAADVLQPDPAPVSPLPRVQTPEQEDPVATSPRARSPTPELEPAATPARACAKKKKRSSLRFLLAAPLALVLFMVASLVCVPPPPGSPVTLNASLSKVSGYFLSVQELHPVELAAWLKQWSSSSLDFVTSYWNALASSQEQEFFGPHTAANLSAAAADDADHGVGFYYSAAETRPVPTEQEPISASIFEQELEIQEVVSASDTVVIAEPEVEEMTAFDDATVEDELTDDAEMVQESVSAASDVIEEELNVLNAEIAEEVSGRSGEEMASFDQEMDIPLQSEPEPEHIVDDMDVPSLQQDVQTDGSEGDQDVHVKEDQEAHHGQKLGSDMWSGYLNKLSKPAVAGSILAVIIVSAALSFHYIRQNQAHVSLNSSEPAEYESAEPVEQAENRSGSGSSEGHTLAKGSQLQHPVVEETERIGGSGGSQYSSSLSSGLGRRKKDKVEENLQSLEPTSRRDSTAYSTSSYGSFTTYEKIPAKKKNKEDEAMTPVRRSSRLRNQVKSPEA